MSKVSVIVDTNVALAANGEAGQASPQCVLDCVQQLEVTIQERRVLLDNAGLILEQYLKQKPHGFPQGPGDIFFVWVLTNQANPEHIRTVPVTPLRNDQRGFAEFPDDTELLTFDQDDRKFVAVALASGESPSILNATDTDWWVHRMALAHHGVRVDFLCPDLMKE